MSKTPDVEDKPAPPPPAPEYKMRSERRAARVAQEKIAESAKYLASNKIMATTSPPPPTKPRNRAKKKVAAAAATASSKATTNQVGQKAVTIATTGASSLLLQKTAGATSQLKVPFAGFKSSSVVRTTSLPIAIRPQMLTGHTLPKMPILVFNSLGTSLPTLIPIPATSLAPNTLVTLAPGGGIHRTLTTTSSTIKNVQHIKSPEILSRPISATPSCPISTKFLRYNNVTRQTMGLTMECEEETLSSAQWSKYRKAESEYMEVLRKLTRWKGRSDVEIVHLGPYDPIPPLPRFLNVQEASRQSVPEKPNRYSSIVDADVIIEMETFSAESDALTPVVQLEDTKEKTASSPRVNVVMIPSPPPPPPTPPLPSQSKVQTPSKESTSTSSSTAKRPVAATIPTILQRKPVAPKKVTNDVAGPQSKQETSTNNSPASTNLSQYPELLVKLSPQKLLSYAHMSGKKLKLDSFMRKLIQSGKSNVDRWMLEKGLFGVNRICLFHPKMQMKLMFMSNPTTNSTTVQKPIIVGASGNVAGNGDGSYKWWCPGCASMMPVDQGSFFAKWNRSHSAILRVIYHWACNSDVRLVVHEMRGDKEFVNSVYAAIRAVCAKQSYRWRVGGAGHPVEIANQELGVCKDVMDVSLYCAYDRLTRHVKLGAASSTSLKSKMSSLFRVLVDKDSYVVGQRALIANLPAHFKNNFMCNSNQIVNLNAIAYLRDFAVPAIKDVRAELKLESIQRLLDELSWREKFGRDPLDAYNSILSHIKQSFVTSVITTKSPHSVPIVSASGSLKVVDASQLNKKCLPTASAAAAAFPPQLIDISSTPTTSTSPAAAAAAAEAPVEENVSLLTDNQEEVIIVDCDLAASIELQENDDEGKTMTKRALSDAAESASPKNGSKAKRVKVDHSAQNNEAIKVSCWMPPIGVQLEPYYYATKEGHVPVVAPCSASCSLDKDKTSTNAKYKFKCHACKKSLEDNTKMMKHLNGHINALKQFNLDLSDLTHCKFCFREFASPYAMQTHVEEVHVAEEPASPVCRICDKEFLDVAALCQHMKLSHVQSEMPYKCLVCKFRTSFYRDIINHFQEMHGGTDKLLCIHCLHVFTVRFGPSIQEGLTYAFYRHVYKHQSKSINRRCPTCCLSFLSGAELQQHRNSDHCTFAKQNGVKPVMASSKSKSIYIDLDVSSEGSSKKERKLLCIECKLSVHKQNHFTNSLSCSSCSYVTCCSHAYSQHKVAAHLTAALRSQLTPFPAPVYELSCACNFTSANGNNMAKHLSRCEKKWCYFSGDADANSMDATFASSKVDLHESDDEEIKTEESAAPLALNGNAPQDNLNH